MPSARVGQALNSPPEQVGPALLDLVEDQWFDRKSARVGARELADALIGFGNADGGTVVVGLSKGSVEGTGRDERHRNEQTQAAIDFSAPPVRSRSRLVPCRTDTGAPDHLLVIEINSGESVSANHRDEVFLRVGDENRKLTFAQRQELVYDKGESTYEGRVLPGSGLADLDDELLTSYVDALEAPNAIRLLQARGLATAGGDLTIAGVLLFASEPQRFLPEAYVRVLRYRGRTRGSGSGQQLVSDRRLEGPVPRQLMATRTAVLDAQPVRRALTASGRFGDVPLVPEDAWLEAVVNAAVHRSYSLAGDHIRVELFDDRIEVVSPGRFPGLVGLSDPLEAPRFARNPRIARVCADLSFGQELGEGIRRIFEEMRSAGLEDPSYRQTSGAVELTLSAEPLDRELEARLPDETRGIIGALRKADRLSTGEVTEILGGVGRPTALRRLRALEQAGLVRWVGKSPKDPRAYWTLPPT